MRPYSPRVRRDLDVVQGETLAARWLDERQPIGNQPVGLGFRTARGGIDPEVKPAESR